MTPQRLINLLRKSGFNVIGNSAFRKDVFGSWVCTDRRCRRDIYVRPTAGISWAERREFILNYGMQANFEADEAVSTKMATVLGEQGLICYSKLNPINTIDGSWVLGKSADFWVKVS